MQPRLALDIRWLDLIYAAICSTKSEENRLFYHHGLICVPALSVRTLWDALLAEYRARRPFCWDVVMSGINIDSMAKLVEAHGLNLKSVDLEQATLRPKINEWREAIEPQTGLCLVAHLFGTKNPIEDLRPRLDQNHIILVEDCAQAFSGTLSLSDGADVALYSFGPIKRWTALGGAIGVFKDPDLANAIAERLKTYPIRSKRSFRIRVLKYMLLKLLSVPLLYRALFMGMTVMGKDIESHISALARGFSGADPSVFRYQMSYPQAAFLKKRLFDAHKMADYSPSAQVLARLEAIKGFCPGERAFEHAFWLFPVLSHDPDALINDLRKEGFDATRGATSLRALASKKGQKSVILKEAQGLMDRLVYLPSPLPKVGKSSFNRLARILTAHFNKHSASQNPL